MERYLKRITLHSDEDLILYKLSRINLDYKLSIQINMRKILLEN
jgi:hypothetical protein